MTNEISYLFKHTPSPTHNLKEYSETCLKPLCWPQHPKSSLPLCSATRHLSPSTPQPLAPPGDAPTPHPAQLAVPQVSPQKGLFTPIIIHCPCTLFISFLALVKVYKKMLLEQYVHQEAAAVQPCTVPSTQEVFNEHLLNK